MKRRARKGKDHWMRYCEKLKPGNEEAFEVVSVNPS